MAQNTTVKSRNSLLIFILISAFYASSKLLKASLSPVATIFISNNILSNVELANLAAIFYLIVALMCLPASIIVTIIGLRRSYAISALLMICGTLFFAISNNFSIFLLSRGIMAIGYSFTFTCSIMVIYNLFAEKLYTLFIASLLFIGYMGAALAGLPLSSIITINNWHYVYMFIALIQVVLFIVTYILLPIEKNYSSKADSPNICLVDILAVLRNKDTFISTAIIGCLIACLFSLADIWGKTYLIEVFGYSVGIAALAGSSLIFIFSAVGALILGYLESIGKINCNAMQWLSILAIITVILFLYGSHDSAVFICILATLIGLSKSSTILVYTYIKKYTHPKYIAIAIAMSTTFEMLFSSTIDFLIGAVLKVSSLLHFTLSDSYRLAMLVIVITLFLNLAMVLKLKKQ